MEVPFRQPAFRNASPSVKRGERGVTDRQGRAGEIAAVGRIIIVERHPADLRAAAVNAVAAWVAVGTGTVTRIWSGRIRVGRVAGCVGRVSVAARRNVARVLRRIAAVAEVIVGRAVGGRAIIRLHVGSAAADVAADPFSLGGKGADQHCGGEGEFGQSFHIILFEAVRQCRRQSPPVLFVHSNSLRP